MGRRLALGVLFSSLAAASAVAAPPAPAPAEDPTAAEAKQHFVQGRREFDLGKYDEAIEEYQLAYNLKNDPALLYNIAQCQRLAGHLELAVAFYKNYLGLVPKSPKREEIERGIGELEKEIAAKKALEPKEKFDALAPNLDRFPEAVRPGGQVRALGATMLVCGLLAGAGFGVGFGLLAANKASEVTYASTNHVPFDPATEAEGRAMQTYSIVSYAVGGAIAVAGAVVLVLGVRMGRASLDKLGMSGAPAWAPLRWTF